MQATVTAYDQTSGTGTLHTDDGTPHTFTADAVHAGGLRLVRAGQRVDVRTVNGRIVGLRIPGDSGQD